MVLLFYVTVALATLLIVCRTAALLPAIASVVAVTMVAMLVHSTLNDVRPVNKRPSLFVMQDNVPPERKYNPKHAKRRIEAYLSLARRIPGVDAAIFPESTLDVAMGEIKELSSELSSGDTVTGWVGAYIQEGEKLFNAIVTLPSLDVAYKKVHLLPYGEYLPRWIGPWTEYLPSFTKPTMHAGKEECATLLGSIPTAPSICYELLFSESIRKRAQKAQLLANVSDLSWLKDPRVSEYMSDVARIRAMEHAKPLILSANGANSLCIDHKGVITDTTHTAGRLFFVCKPTLFEGMTPYARLGVLGVGILVLIWSVIIWIFSDRFHCKEG